MSFRFIATKFAAAALAATCLSAPALAQKIELWTFVGPGQANVRERAMAQVIDTFKARNPGVDVNVTVMPWQQLGPTLLRASKAGQVPDVAMLYSPSMPAHMAAGTLSPLKTYMDAWTPAQRADLVTLPETRDRQGNVFGVPWEMRVSGMGYRDDLLKAANKRPPQSIKEWGEVAGAVATPDIAGIAIGFSPEAPSVAAGWFLTTLVGSGVKVLTDDGKAAFNTPQAERLVQWVVDQSANGKQAIPQNVALQGLEQAQTLFIAQKAVFLPQSSQRFEFIRERSKLGDQVKLAPYPGWEDGKPSPALVQSWSLVIPKGAKNSGRRVEADRPLELHGGAGGKRQDGRIRAGAHERALRPVVQRPESRRDPLGRGLRREASAQVQLPREHRGPVRHVGEDVRPGAHRQDGAERGARLGGDGVQPARGPLGP